MLQGKGDSRVALTASRGHRCQRGHGLGAGGGERDAHLRHDDLEAVELGAGGDAVGQQAIALRHGALEFPGARAVGGVEAQDKAIEEAAPLGARAGEQAVGRRRDPDHLDIVGEGAGAGFDLAVDADDLASAIRIGLGGDEAGADVDGAEARMDAGGDRPAAVAAITGEIGERRLPQALAGRQQRHRLENVGLAGAVGTGEHDRLGAEPERQRVIVAEVRQRQPLDPEAGCRLIVTLSVPPWGGCQHAITRASASARTARRRRRRP